MSIKMSCVFAMAVAATAALAGAATAADGETSKSRILIAYFSHSGTTAKVADLIQKEIGGTLHRIEPVKQYPAERQAVLDQGRKETEEGVLPALKGETPSLDGIDIVLIGGPVWYGTLAPPVASFIAQANLKGKTVAPFCTYGGGLGGYFRDFAEVMPGEATTLKGLDLSRVGQMPAENLEKAIKDWLASLPIPASQHGAQ